MFLANLRGPLSRFQEALGAEADLVFQHGKVFFRKALRGAAREVEIQRLADLRASVSRHQPGSLIEEITVQARPLHFSIESQRLAAFPVITERLVEERIAVVEQGRWRNDPVRSIVGQEAEIAEVPVRVADQRIERHHVRKRLPEPLAHGVAFGHDRLPAILLHDAGNGHEGMSCW